jgi:hypothetical protein
MPYAEPTLDEIQAFVETLDLHALAKEILCLKRHLDVAGEPTGANSRDAALTSLLGLIEFVQNQLGYQIPPPALTGLHTALAALDDGAVLPLLQKRKVARKPVSVGTRQLHGCAAAVMQCLMQSGFGRLEAGTIVGNQLRKLGIKFGDSRSKDPGKSIANWRNRATGGDPATDPDTEIYRELCARFGPSGNRDTDKRTLIKVLRESLRNLGVTA